MNPAKPPRQTIISLFVNSDLVEMDLRFFQCTSSTLSNNESSGEFLI